MSRLRLRPVWGVVAVALVGSLMRLPFLGRPLASDEAGFLIIAGQWSPGHSLYGDYWVDRPPLLIGLYQLAHLMGGAVGLRVIGLLALVVSAGFAAAIGRLASGHRWAPVVVAALPAVLMGDMLFGALEVDGELLAVPFVIAGAYAVLRALAAPAGSRGRRLSWVAGGVLAVLAGSVKQSMAEVFVGAGIGVLWLLWQRRWAQAVQDAALFALGVALGMGAMVGWAAANGTSASGLFDAVVTFRGQAAEVISNHASEATTERAHKLFEAFAAGGVWGFGALAVIGAVLWWRRRHRVDRPEPVLPLAWIATGVAAWETFGVLAGGSYWLHYLIGMIPGTTLLVAATLRGRQVRLRWILVVLTYVLVCAVCSAITYYNSPMVETEVAVSHYLQEHASPGESAVTAFGHVNMLEDTGLTIPYEHMWSLPVRVRDSHLTEFTRVLTQEHPTWVIIAGPRIDTWAIDADSANAVIARDYTPVAHIGEWYVFRSRALTPLSGKNGIIHR